MTKTIWKFPFKTEDRFSLMLPKNAIILTVQTQFNEPTMWALVEAEAGTVYRHFAIYGTGHIVSEDKQAYIGTYQLDGGNYVFHVFEIINP